MNRLIAGLTTITAALLVCAPGRRRHGPGQGAQGAAGPRKGRDVHRRQHIPEGVFVKLTKRAPGGLGGNFSQPANPADPSTLAALVSAGHRSGHTPDYDAALLPAFADLTLRTASR